MNVERTTSEPPAMIACHFRVSLPIISLFAPLLRARKRRTTDDAINIARRKSVAQRRRKQQMNNILIDRPGKKMLSVMCGGALFPSLVCIAVLPPVTIFFLTSTKTENSVRFVTLVSSRKRLLCLSSDRGSSPTFDYNRVLAADFYLPERKYI